MSKNIFELFIINHFEIDNFRQILQMIIYSKKLRVLLILKGNRCITRKSWYLII